MDSYGGPRKTVPGKPEISDETGRVLVYHGTNLARAGSILFSGGLSGDASPIYPDSTPGFVCVTTDFRHAIRYARNAYCLDGDQGTGIPAGNLLVVFRLCLTPNVLLADVDELNVDEELREETGCPFYRAEVSRRIAGLVPVCGHHVAFINPMHREFRRMTADMAQWHKIPELFSDQDPLSL